MQRRARAIACLICRRWTIAISPFDLFEVRDVGIALFLLIKVPIFERAKLNQKSIDDIAEVDWFFSYIVFELTTLMSRKSKNTQRYTQIVSHANQSCSPLFICLSVFKVGMCFRFDLTVPVA